MGTRQSESRNLGKIAAFGGVVNEKDVHQMLASSDVYKIPVNYDGFGSELCVFCEHSGPCEQYTDLLCSQAIA